MGDTIPGCTVEALTGVRAFLWYQLAVDEDDRVMALVFEPGRGMSTFLFENDSWRSVADFGQSQIEGRTIFAATGLRALDDSFYGLFLLSRQCCDFAIAEYRNNAWEGLVTPDNVLRESYFQFSALTGAYDVNRQGEVAYAVEVVGGQIVALLRAARHGRSLPRRGPQTTASGSATSRVSTSPMTARFTSTA